MGPTNIYFVCVTIAFYTVIKSLYYFKYKKIHIKHQLPVRSAQSLNVKTCKCILTIFSGTGCILTRVLFCFLFLKESTEEECRGAKYIRAIAGGTLSCHRRLPQD